MNEQGNVFRDVPHGAYTVEVYKMELTASKDNEPLVTIWFEVVEGEYTGSLIFMNQVITRGFQIHVVNELLRSLVAEFPAISVKFESYRQYSEMLTDIAEAVDGKRFALEYGEGRKGFSTYEISAA